MGGIWVCMEFQQNTVRFLAQPVILETVLTVVNLFWGECMPKSGQELEFRSKEGCKNLWARFTWPRLWPRELRLSVPNGLASALWKFHEEQSQFGGGPPVEGN